MEHRVEIPTDSAGSKRRPHITQPAGRSSTWVAPTLLTLAALGCCLLGGCRADAPASQAAPASGPLPPTVLAVDSPPRVPTALHAASAAPAESGATSTLLRADQLAPPPPLWSDDANFDDIPGSFEPHGTLAASCRAPAPGATAAAAAAAAAEPIPLKDGLMLVTAWRRFNGDNEEELSVSGIDHGDMRVTYSGTAFKDEDDAQGTTGTFKRHLCAADLAAADTYVTEFRTVMPEIIPGVTTLQVSGRTFREVSTAGATQWTMRTYMKAFYSERWVPVDRVGEMRRVEATDVPWNLIINGQRVEVPTIHLKGRLTFTGPTKVKALLRDPQYWSQDAEVYVLDEPANPVVLRYVAGPVFRIQVVAVTFPQDKPVNTIATQLGTERRAVVYGISFDFNNDTIRPTSEPVLAEIAAALKDHPDWHLKVEGHTDNIGGDAYNLSLSQRRAASVKRALVERHLIAENRLTPAGFGASRPVDTNETLEGRARNRRVELSRD
jgi:outer membrane protein OmpA-like peptidoglycan-associated protein